MRAANIVRLLAAGYNNIGISQETGVTLQRAELSPADPVYVTGAVARRSGTIADRGHKHHAYAHLLHLIIDPKCSVDGRTPNRPTSTAD